MGQLNYTYGQPALMVKNMTKNSHYSWNGRRTPLNIEIKDNKRKLKGWFIPNIFLGLGINIKNDWSAFYTTVRMLIAACYIDYMVVSKALSAPLTEPEVMKVKEDIDKIVFDRESFIVGAYASFHEFWESSYERIISDVRNKVIDEWQDKQPCKEIQNLFSNSYTYKVRRTKWKWLEGKTEEEIAKEIFNMGKVDLDSDMISALKHRHLSVKSVLDSLNKLVDTLPSQQKEELSDVQKAKKWVYTLEQQQIKDIQNVLCQQDVTLEIMLVNAYHMDMSIAPDIARRAITEVYDEIETGKNKFANFRKFLS